ncbi:YbgA family protein [Vagococcus silagei]|nr:YbgA family protein [Vagococcus silagei]
MSVRKEAGIMAEDNKELLHTFQKSWAQNKYWVMSRSQQQYNAIRLLAKGNDWSEEKHKQYQEILQRLEHVSPTEKTLRVTYQHIWGYFKRSATLDEKNKFKELSTNYLVNQPQIEPFLKTLADKYKQEYLLNMRWLL